MTDQVNQDSIEEGTAISNQLIESKSNVVTGKHDQQLQELKLYVEEVMKRMDNAVNNVLTPQGGNNNTHFFNTPQSAATPQPITTPAVNPKPRCLNELMDHLCNMVLKIPSNSVIYDQEEVMTLIELVTLSKEDIFGIEDRAGIKIKKVDARKLQHLTWWYVEEAAKYPSNNMPDEHWLLKTNSDFEFFRRTRVPLLSRGDINTKSVHISQDNDTDALAQWSKNLKLGIESFPEFKGHIEKWLPFKRKFMATAKTHELDILFEKEIPSFIPGSPSERLFKKKNEFVYSVFLQKVSGGPCILAMRKHASTQCARSTFFAFIDYFESPENKMVISQKCQSIIEGLELTHNYPGGVASFVTKLENTYMDLEYCTGIPKSDLDKKTKLLLSIKDNRLYNMRDNFCTNPETTFQSCLTLLTQHDTMLSLIHI